MRLGKKRDPVLTLVFTLLTCGLYYLYFIYQASLEIGEFLGQSDYSPAVELLLSVVTCGLWNIYWDYRTGKKIAQMSAQVGLPPTDHSVLYLVLDLFGAGGFASLGLVNPILQQDGLNRVWEAAQMGPPQDKDGAKTPRQPRPPLK